MLTGVGRAGTTGGGSVAPGRWDLAVVDESGEPVPDGEKAS